MSYICPYCGRKAFAVLSSDPERLARCLFCGKESEQPDPTLRARVVPDAPLPPETETPAAAHHEGEAGDDVGTDAEGAAPRPADTIGEHLARSELDRLLHETESDNGQEEDD